MAAEEYSPKEFENGGYNNCTTQSEGSRAHARAHGIGYVVCTDIPSHVSSDENGKYED